LSDESGSILCFLFFFQAEDGIRDFHVTGVQTCALPISTSTDDRAVAWLSASDTLRPMASEEFVPVGFEPPRSLITDQFRLEPLRSEERRVGKGCWARWSAWHCGRKKLRTGRAGGCVSRM